MKPPFVFHLPSNYHGYVPQAGLCSFCLLRRVGSLLFEIPAVNFPCDPTGVHHSDTDACSIVSVVSYTDTRQQRARCCHELIVASGSSIRYSQPQMILSSHLSHILFHLLYVHCRSVFPDVPAGPLFVVADVL